MKTFLIIFCALFLLPACTTRRDGSKPPKYHGSITDFLDFSQEGDAENPGEMSFDKGENGFEIPAGTAVSIDPSGVVSFTPASPVKVSGMRFSGSIRGPSAYAPPAPPTPEEEADGKARWLAWLAVILGSAAGIFLFVKGWPQIAAGSLCIAAGGVVVIALGAVPDWVYTFGIVGVTLIVAGWAVWTFYLSKKLPPTS